MLTSQPQQPAADFVSAAEAFDAIADRIPVIKAWERNPDGSILILGSHLLTVGADGTLTFSKEGLLCSALPLMMSAEAVRHRVLGSIENLSRSYKLRPKHLAPSIESYLATGKMDSRLAHKTREAIREDTHRLAQSTGRISPNDIQLIAEHACGMEITAFLGRVSARIHGYSRSPTGLAKLINSVLWSDVYDRDIARAAILTFGKDASTGHYNRILAGWRRHGASGRNRGLEALLKTHRPAFPVAEILQRSDLFQGDSSAKGSYAENPGIWRGRSVRDEADDLCAIIEQTPQILKRLGLKPAFWRFLLKCSVPQLQTIKGMISNAVDEATMSANLNSDPWRLWHTPNPAGPRSSDNANRESRSTVAFLNRLADFDPRDLPFSFLRALNPLQSSQRAALLPHLRAIVQGAAAARKKRCIRADAQQIQLIADALAALSEDSDNSLSRVRNATWNTLIRIQADWHEANQYERDSDLAVTWDKLLDEFSADGIIVTELTSGKALREEGRALHHCVAGYAHACATGNTRIFSLIDEKNPRTRSTLELRLGVGWRQAQHRSYCNQQPSKKLQAAARKVVAAANRAQTALPNPLPLAA